MGWAFVNKLQYVLQQLEYLFLGMKCNEDMSCALLVETLNEKQQDEVDKSRGKKRPRQPKLKRLKARRKKFLYNLLRRRGWPTEEVVKWNVVLVFDVVVIVVVVVLPYLLKVKALVKMC